MTIQNVGVFCGTSLGESAEYEVQARALAQVLAEEGLGLVYGGSAAGLMGVLAEELLEHNGRVVGVISDELVRMGAAHPKLDELIVLPNLDQRKQRLIEMADATIVLPGGLGTLDETFGFLTASQLSLHSKPGGFLNVEGYFDHLRSFLEHVVGEGFVKRAHERLFIFDNEPRSLISQLKNFEPPREPKWVNGKTS